MYTNCTHVQNNLEIVYLDDDDDYDLSFLSNIREVCTEIPALYILISSFDIICWDHPILLQCYERFGARHNSTLRNFVATQTIINKLGI